MSERPDHGPDQGADRLRRALLDAVPEAPFAPGRAGAVRRLAARRRRRTTAAVGLAAAMVVAVPSLGIALAGGGRDEPVAAPTPSRTASPTHDQQVDCPPLPAEGVDDAGAGTLPGGAVAVRLCTGEGVGFQEPGDLLTTDVDALVDLVNAQPVTGPSDVCAMDLGIGYRLAVGYPGGTVRVVAGELYGCHALTVGDTVRANPERIWQRTIALLRRQRAGAGPPADVSAPPLACRPPAGGADGIEISPVARPEEMTTAIACVRYESASDQPARSVEVPAADLRVLMGDLAGRSRSERPTYEPCGPDVPGVMLVGATPWGDRTSVSSWCGVFDVPGPDWAPSPPAQAVLDRLVAEAGRPLPTVDASSTAAEVVGAYVDLVNAGERDAAAALWAGEAQLPPRELRIGFKAGNARPLRTISRWRDAVEVEALYWEYDEEEGASGDYDEVRFLVVRDSDDAPYRIQSRGPTGR